MSPLPPALFLELRRVAGVPFVCSPNPCRSNQGDLNTTPYASDRSSILTPSHQSRAFSEQAQP